MRHALLSVAIFAALSFSAAADALTCNIVLDRNDAVIYRDTAPPIDLSERGWSARAAMRRRGEFLLMMEADQCASFVAQTGAAGAGASVEEIVAGLRAYPGAAGTTGVMSSARPTVGAAPAPAAAPAPRNAAGPPGAPRR